MNKFEYTLRDNKYKITKKSLNDFILCENKNINYIISTLNDIILFKYGNLKNNCDILYQYYIDNTDLYTKTIKELNINERRLKLLLNKIKEYNNYRFLIIGGGTCETISILEETDSEAWKTINNIILNCFNGHVRGALCLEKNDDDIGTLYNLNAMFTPKIPNKINSVKADDLLPNWNNYK